MTSNIVARRYARALFSLGKKKGLAELEKNGTALVDMCTAVTESAELHQVFTNPVFSLTDKTEIIKKLGKKLKLTAAVTNFFLLLAEKKRLEFTKAITAIYTALLDEEKGIVRGKLITALALDEKKQKDIVAGLEKEAKCTLDLDFVVSPDILGGVVLHVGDRIMDASLRAQLSILKDTIKRGE